MVAIQHKQAEVSVEIKPGLNYISLQAKITYLKVFITFISFRFLFQAHFYQFVLLHIKKKVKHVADEADII